MANGACGCKVELNHLNSMQLMFMEAMADRSVDGMRFYKTSVLEAIASVGKCTKADVSAGMDFAKQLNDSAAIKDAIRPNMRLLQDAYWHTLFKVCAGGNSK